MTWLKKLIRPKFMYECSSGTPVLLSSNADGSVTIRVESKECKAYWRPAPALTTALGTMHFARAVLAVLDRGDHLDDLPHRPDIMDTHRRRAVGNSVRDGCRGAE